MCIWFMKCMVDGIVYVVGFYLAHGRVGMVGFLPLRDGDCRDVGKLKPDCELRCRMRNLKRALRILLLGNFN